MSGANFASNSVVLWNGSVRATTFVNSTQLTAVVLAADLATEGTRLVTVANAAPNAATSAALPFTVMRRSAAVQHLRRFNLQCSRRQRNHSLTLTGTDFYRLRW